MTERPDPGWTACAGGWRSWRCFGDLEATHGNQNHRIPADADLTGMRSVVVWCDRFDVAFGSAPVRL